MSKMKRSKNAPPIWFVAFDGEEATDDADFYGTGLRGSKPFAKKYAKKIKELVLLDFVANKQLAIPYEASSNAEMWADLREAAERVGSDSACPDTQQGVVEDDHTPFLRRGVPSIDLIDFNFPCWHKPCDDLTAVSKTSLDKSGEAVLEFLRNRRARAGSPPRSARRRRRSSASPTPRSGSPRARARRSRRPSTSRPPGCAPPRSAAPPRAPD